MRIRGAVGGDGHLAKLLLVGRDVLREQLRQQLEVVGAHSDSRINANEPRLLRSPLSKVQHEAQGVAVDEHGIRVDHLAGALLDLDPDRQLTHSSTTNTWPSLTTSVSLTRISLTLPARGAVTEISIFIDSRIKSTSSSTTSSPGFAVIFHTLPTSSALTSVMPTFRTGPDSAPGVAGPPDRAAIAPPDETPPHGRARAPSAPPSRLPRHCSSPSFPPPGRSCPRDRREHCRPW